jgi:hypothetical protein
MPTSKVSRGEAPGTVGLTVVRAASRAIVSPRPRLFYFSHMTAMGFVFAVGATFGDLPHQKPRSHRLLSKRQTGGR